MTTSHARWSSHLPANVDPALRNWLTEAGSLTARLIAHSTHFRVRRIRQSSGLVGRDEQHILQLPRQVQLHQRDVVLECDGRPVVFAQSCVPFSATASDWPIFSRLGERSLGSILFGDPLVRRGSLQFARLPRRHPLFMQLEIVLGPQDNLTLFARRCLYQRRHGVLLLTEIFLPCIIDLA
jgi:chorismate--pyruvate lyase